LGNARRANRADGHRRLHRHGVRNKARAGSQATHVGVVVQVGNCPITASCSHATVAILAIACLFARGYHRQKRADRDDVGRRANIAVAAGGAAAGRRLINARAEARGNSSNRIRTPHAAINIRAVWIEKASDRRAENGPSCLAKIRDGVLHGRERILVDG